VVQARDWQGRLCPGATWTATCWVLLRRELFKYYHERLPPRFPFPAQPAWKAGDSPEHEEAPHEEPDAEGGEMHHDDVLGEGVSPQGLGAGACGGGLLAAPQKLVP
jgi:hypothetical protein